MEELAFHWSDFLEIWYLCIFRKLLEKFQVSLKADNKNRYFTWRTINIFDHMSLISSQNEKCYRHICRGNKITLLCSWKFFSKIVPFKTIWKINIVERGRPQMTIWRTRNACWITKSTHPHSQHVIFIAFPLQQWLYESASMLFCTYAASLVLLLSCWCEYLCGAAVFQMDAFSLPCI